MEGKDLTEYIDQQRWLLNNGLISDNVKNQLFFYGSIVHKDVQAVELDVVPEQKKVSYKIYVDKTLMKKIELFNKFSTATSLFALWRFKRFLKKEGSLDFHRHLSRFVSEFCGPSWSTTVEVIDFGEYVDKAGDEVEPDGTGQPGNKLPY